MTREEMLKDLILEQFGSIRKFADYIETPSSTITSMLSRGVGGTSIDTVLKVCDALGITTEDLKPENDSEQKIKPNTIAAHLDGVGLSKKECEELDNTTLFYAIRTKANGLQLIPPN